MANVRIAPEWKALLEPEFNKFYFDALVQFVRSAYAQNRVYPPPARIFAAFDACPLSRLKVVILGQDPYHEEGQAEGLAFSVPPGIPTPPSLRNILAEIAQDTGAPSLIQGGHLEPWARQGVLLLNATLTVQAGMAASHQGKGWETFTDAVIERVSAAREHLVFLLWGAYARRKAPLIDRSKHLILEAPHPSPLSAHRGFMGCKHFSKANQYLLRHGLDPIRW